MRSPSGMLGLAGICHFYLRSYEPSIPSILFLRKEAWKTNALLCNRPNLLDPGVEKQYCKNYFGDHRKPKRIAG